MSKKYDSDKKSNKKKHCTTYKQTSCLFLQCIASSNNQPIKSQFISNNKYQYLSKTQMQNISKQKNVPRGTLLVLQNNTRLYIVHFRLI